MNEDVFVLLLGANEGAYALAAAFSGEYGVPVCLLDETVPDEFYGSAFFAEIRRVPGIDYPAMLLRALGDFYEAHSGKSLILLPTTEHYAACLLSAREVLERMYLLPQKKAFAGIACPTDAVGVLLSYIGREGSVRTLYGAIAAKATNGAPLAVLTGALPQTVILPAEDTPGFALYAVTKEGTCFPITEDGTLPPLVAFASAADTSLAEWILSDYVLCEAMRESGEKHALFSLYSRRKTGKYLLDAERREAKDLLRRRLFATLYPHKGERRVPWIPRSLRRFYRESLQKRTKPKK